MLQPTLGEKAAPSKTATFPPHSWGSSENMQLAESSPEPSAPSGICHTEMIFLSILAEASPSRPQDIKIEGHGRLVVSDEQNPVHLSSANRHVPARTAPPTPLVQRLLHYIIVISKPDIPSSDYQQSVDYIGQWSHRRSFRILSKICSFLNPVLRQAGYLVQRWYFYPDWLRFVWGI